MLMNYFWNTLVIWEEEWTCVGVCNKCENKNEERSWFATNCQNTISFIHDSNNTVQVLRKKICKNMWPGVLDVVWDSKKGSVKIF